jgi:hypothetical protein
MGKSKMDEAAADRIRKARGDKVRGFKFLPLPPLIPKSSCSHCACTQDGFSKRAAIAARQNKEGDSPRKKDEAEKSSKHGGGGDSGGSSK